MSKEQQPTDATDRSTPQSEPAPARLTPEEHKKRLEADPRFKVRKGAGMGFIIGGVKPNCFSLVAVYLADAYCLAITQSQKGPSPACRR